MKSDLVHLPAIQQAELARITQLLLGEFAASTSRATQPWKKNGRVLKIILFGSYARNDWVDEPDNGYQSDYDLLIIVSHADLTDVSEYWYVAEDKIQRDEAIVRPVNLIVHTLGEVNQALGRGEYFWVDIARDGIALYELPGSALAAPKALTSADAYDMAKDHFDRTLGDIDVWIETASAQTNRDVDATRYRRHAIFNLHQATETAYACYLLVRKLYFPRSHNIKFLRSLAEDSEPRLIVAWPRASRLDRRRFELIKRAYVEARYSTTYQIELDDLEAIARSVAQLRILVDEVCRERLDTLRAQAGL